MIQEEIPNRLWEMGSGSPGRGAGADVDPGARLTGAQRISYALRDEVGSGPKKSWGV